MNFRGYGHCSDHVGETMRVAAVTKPKPPPDQLEDLLRQLLANMVDPVPVPAPVQEVPMVAKLRQRLVVEIQSRQPAAVTKPKPPPDQLEDQLRRLLANMAAPVPVPAPVPLVPTVNNVLCTVSGGGDTESPAGGCEFTRARGVRIVPLGTTDIGTTDSADTSQKGSGWRRERAHGGPLKMYILYVLTCFSGPMH